MRERRYHECRRRTKGRGENGEAEKLRQGPTASRLGEKQSEPGKQRSTGQKSGELRLRDGGLEEAGSALVDNRFCSLQHIPELLLLQRDQGSLPETQAERGGQK